MKRKFIANAATIACAAVIGLGMATDAAAAVATQSGGDVSSSTVSSGTRPAGGLSTAEKAQLMKAAKASSSGCSGSPPWPRSATRLPV